MPSPSHSGGSSSESLQVILIEDNPGDARLFREYCTQASRRIELRWEESVADGRDALERDRPDVLVADLGLPDSSGVATVEALRAADGKLPLVVLTGGDDIELALEAQRAGATEYLQKDELSPQLVERTLHWAVERVRMERAIQERELSMRRQKQLLEQTQRLAGAWEYDVASGALSWTDEVYRIHELPPGEPVSVDEAITFYPGQAKSVIRTAFERCLEEGEPFDVELPLRTAKNNQRWVRSVGSAIRSSDGEIVKVAGAFQDITERKKEQRRREEVITRVTDAIVEIDGDWRFTLVNEEAEELYDMRAKELLGKHFWDVFESALGTRFEEEYRRVMETREHTEFVEYYEGLNGWFDIQVYPNEDGGLAFYFKEVTEQKRREQELIEAKEEAEQMNRLKSAFLANMSHEIRTPLTSIVGFADILEEETSSEYEAVVKPIQTGARRLLDTLNSVLDLAQLESGTVELTYDRHDVTDLVRNVTQAMRPKAEQKGLDLVEQMPDASIDARVDQGAVERILTNLLDNAIKFTEEGEIRVLVEIAGGDELVIEVTDTGIGLDQANVNSLYQAFQQESTGLDRSYEGAGLGLAIVDELTDLLDGSVDVQSERGHGTTFSIRLPRRLESDADQLEVNGAAPAIEVLPTGQRLLVLDDDPAAGQLVRHMVPEGWTVDVSKTADSALSKAQNATYDIIFLDINLGGERDGSDVMREMRTLDHLSDTPIVAVTAYALPGDEAAFLDAGFDEYISKPFTREVLKKHLQKLFGHTSGSDEFLEPSAGDG